MGRVRAGGHDDSEYAAVYVDFHGAYEQRTVSVGGSEQGGAVGDGDYGSQGAGGEVELVAFYKVAVAADGGGFGYDGDILEL